MTGRLLTHAQRLLLVEQRPKRQARAAAMAKRYPLDEMLVTCGRHADTVARGATDVDALDTLDLSARIIATLRQHGASVADGREEAR
ncbi:MAG: hypothetical protein ACRDNM_00830 [Gaiellaceae bacterium]